MSSSIVFSLSTGDSKSEEVIYKPSSRALSSFVSSHPPSHLLPGGGVCTLSVFGSPHPCDRLVTSSSDPCQWGIIRRGNSDTAQIPRNMEEKIRSCIYSHVRDKRACQISHQLLSVLTAPPGGVSPWKFTRKKEPESMMVVWIVFPRGSVSIVWVFSQKVLL